MTQVLTSTLVESQFPEEIQANGPNFVAFMQAYYKWLEVTGVTASDQLLQLRDIDSTIDDLIPFFKSTYLANLPSLTVGDIKQFIKYANDFYNVRGTKAGIKMLFQLLYGVDADVYTPSVDIIKASDGTWLKPNYLELSPSLSNAFFIGKQITGASSGATAFVESIARRVNGGGAFYDVAQLSNLRGTFSTGEIISSNGSVIGNPIVTGSLQSIDIIDGGSNHSVGDIFEINSDYGQQGLARVASAQNGTGKVNFNLVSGGTGYTVNAIALVSNNVFTVNNTTGSFINFETIYQSLADVGYLGANGAFKVGDTVYGTTAGSNTFQAVGIVVLNTSASANSGILKISVANTYSDFLFADNIVSNSNVFALVANTANTSATANLVQIQSQTLGVTSVVNNFLQNVVIVGKQSGATTTLIGQSTGSGATFSVGALGATETVVVNSDLIGGVNVANTPYASIRLDGQGSGIGLVSNVSVTSGGSGYANGASVVFVGGGHILANVSIAASGRGYANGERIVLNSNTGQAAGIVSTNSNGSIVGTTINPSHTSFSIPPVITISTASGTNANLVPVMSTVSTAKAIVNTNANGSITSVTVTNAGNGYYTIPTLSVAGGNGAILTPNMLFGYGFPKNPYGNKSSIINSMLTQKQLTLGTISSISNISPGNGYNANPGVVILEPLIASLNHKDLIVTVANVNGTFILNEPITQSFTNQLLQLNFSNITGNTSFDLNEVVTQNNTSGVVAYRDTQKIELTSVYGNFAANSTPIIGNISNAHATVSATSNVAAISVAKGTVSDIQGNTIFIHRNTFNTNFSSANTIQGATSGATAQVVSILQNDATLAEGNNASITALVQTANGIATSLEVTNSGFGYYDGEIVTLTNPDSNTVIKGVANLGKEGKGEGRWTTTRGFLNSDKYIHDGNYYQAYSYEIQSKISLDTYAPVIYDLSHVAGTKLFGKVIIKSSSQNVINTNSNIQQFMSTPDDASSLFLAGVI